MAVICERNYHKRTDDCRGKLGALLSLPAINARIRSSKCFAGTACSKNSVALFGLFTNARKLTVHLKLTRAANEEYSRSCSSISVSLALLVGRGGRPGVADRFCTRL